MTACMQDGNTETVVVCIAFVPTEAKEHWLWFCRNLRESLELDWSTITFMSDRGKGLVPAMTEVFPGMNTGIVLCTLEEIWSEISK